LSHKLRAPQQTFNLSLLQKSFVALRKLKT
jgi:hypothetical protein